MSKASRPPPVLHRLLALLDPTDDGAGIVIAPDLLAQHPEIGPNELLERRSFLDQVLADDTTSNADLKGMLNRLAGRAWGVPFDFGGDAKGARRFLEALQAALSRKLS